MRVLHVTPYYAPAYVYGGPTRSLPLLCEALAAAGTKVTVLTTDANGRASLDVPLAECQNLNGVDVYYFARMNASSRFKSLGLERACRQQASACDVVHITGLWTHPAAIAARAARDAQRPYIVSPRGMLMPWEYAYKSWKKVPYFHAFERPRLRRAAGIHCTTEAEAQALAPYGLDARAFIVPNIVETVEFRQTPPRGRLRAKLGITSGERVLLFMGRLHPKKGIEELLEAFHALCAVSSDVHLILAGPDEGNYSARIESWAAESRLSGRVHQIGELHGEQRLQAYVDADAFVSLSRSENFGMSVAEAIVSGLPVVVSAGVGISDWAGRHKVALPCDRSTTSVVEAVLTALESTSSREARSMRGLQLIEQEFGAEVVAGAMMTAYHRASSRTCD